MKFVLTKKEFDKDKKEILNKLDIFMKDYDNFTKKVKPKYWRETGEDYFNLKKTYKDIKNSEPIDMNDLESDIVRDEVLSSEEIDLWNKMKSYNL